MRLDASQPLIVSLLTVMGADAAGQDVSQIQDHS